MKFSDLEPIDALRLVIELLSAKLGNKIKIDLNSPEVMKVMSDSSYFRLAFMEGENCIYIIRTNKPLNTSDELIEEITNQFNIDIPIGECDA